MRLILKSLFLSSACAASVCFGQAVGPPPPQPVNPIDPTGPVATTGPDAQKVKPADSKPPRKTATPEELAARAEKAKLAQQYIAALSADAYMDRADAKQKLIALGRPAIEPLESAARAEDSETRLRAMEILITMRGRGFLGIGLEEEDVEVPGAQDGFVATERPGSVRANQVIDFRQGYQQRYGVKRPFPAETAGMEQGDRMVEINGRPIRGIKDLMTEIILTGPGRTASIVFERGGATKRVHALLTRNPMLVFQNEVGFQQSMPNEKPSVDLEEEIDFSEVDKRANLKPDEAALPAEFFIDE